MENGIAKAMIWLLGNTKESQYDEAARKSFSIGILQAYSPVQDYSDEDIERFCEEIQQASNLAASSKEIPQASNEVVLVMGDLNAKVGMEALEDAVGKFGIGNKNKRGDS